MNPCHLSCSFADFCFCVWLRASPSQNKQEKYRPVAVLFRYIHLHVVLVGHVWGKKIGQKDFHCGLKFYWIDLKQSLLCISYTLESNEVNQCVQSNCITMGNPCGINWHSVHVLYIVLSIWRPSFVAFSWCKLMNVFTEQLRGEN